MDRSNFVRIGDSFINKNHITNFHITSITKPGIVVSDGGGFVMRGIIVKAWVVVTLNSGHINCVKSELGVDDVPLDVNSHNALIAEFLLANTRPQEQKGLNDKTHSEIDEIVDGVRVREEAGLRDELEDVLFDCLGKGSIPMEFVTDAERKRLNQAPA